MLQLDLQDRFSKFMKRLSIIDTYNSSDVAFPPRLVLNEVKELPSVGTAFREAEARGGRLPRSGEASGAMRLYTVRAPTGPPIQPSQLIRQESKM
jgi:hypothetical protein